MTKRLEPDFLRAKALCYACVRDDYLSNAIQRAGQHRVCSYYRNRRPSTSVPGLAGYVAAAFERHYWRTPDQPDSLQARASDDPEMAYAWEREGEPVVDAIKDAAGIPEEAARDIQAVPAEEHGSVDPGMVGVETEFDADSHYLEWGRSGDAWNRKWTEFTLSLKTEARFFNPTTAEHLGSVFKDLGDRTADDGKALIVSAGPERCIRVLYRARAFQSLGELTDALRRPDRDLGPPPPDLAGAGRMNAQGISVFYGAIEPEVAIAEVRPPVGSRVAVACFEIIRPLRLFDFTALVGLRESGSVFDPGFADRLERVMFLQSFGERIARPVMPNDEAFDYLPTQVIAEFLAKKHEPRLDGVIFDTAQASGSGVNVVLFHSAARVAQMELPAGVKIAASSHAFTETGPQEEYSVLELLPCGEPAEPAGQQPERAAWDKASPGGGCRAEDPDPRKRTLRVDPHSVVVHHVQQVDHRTRRFPVHRFQDEDGPVDF